MNEHIETDEAIFWLCDTVDSRIEPEDPRAFDAWKRIRAHIDAQAAELTRLHSLLPTTADGVNLADCPELYCPHCGDKVLQYPACCVCENCGSDESGPMELEYCETVSKPKETERA